MPEFSPGWGGFGRPMGLLSGWSSLALRSRRRRDGVEDDVEVCGGVRVAGFFSLVVERVAVVFSFRV